MTNLANGKTILCRSSETNRFQSLADIDHPELRVMVNWPHRCWKSHSHTARSGC